ncbi:MAG TPA: hypothetical protein VI937_03480 [Negativicutes bacterium]|nr:hypothetical protein [Negativicutes bacterium]
MGKSFWVVLCCLGFCMASSVLAVYAIEEYRWQGAVGSVKDLVEALERMDKATTGLIKILHDFGEQEKAQQAQGRHQERQKKMEKMKQFALDGIARSDGRVNEGWNPIPTLQEFFDNEKKTNLRNVIFSVLSFAFVMFVATTATKTKRRLSQEATRLAAWQEKLDKEKKQMEVAQEGMKRQREFLDAAAQDLEKRKSFLENLLSSPDSPAKNPRKKKREPEPGVFSSDGQPASDTPGTWKFWIVSSPADAGQELPGEEKQFLEVLQSALEKANYRSFDPVLVYRKLGLFCGISPKQRHAWRKKVIQGPFMGWKILRIGRKQRLFLLVDEENKSIRLIPFLRDQAYS